MRLLLCRASSVLTRPCGHRRSDHISRVPSFQCHETHSLLRLSSNLSICVRNCRQNGNLRVVELAADCHLCDARIPHKRPVFTSSRALEPRKELRIVSWVPMLSNCQTSARRRFIVTDKSTPRGGGLKSRGSLETAFAPVSS